MTSQTPIQKDYLHSWDGTITQTNNEDIIVRNLKDLKESLATKYSMEEGQEGELLKTRFCTELQNKLKYMLTDSLIKRSTK